MVQPNRRSLGLLVLALAAASAASAGTWIPHGAGWVPVASNDDARTDYLRGFEDGVRGRDDRERDKDYRNGYRAGRAKRESNERRPEGRDYQRGYLDGWDDFRERKAVGSKNRSYAAGYRAGQAEHTRLAANFGGSDGGSDGSSSTPVKTVEDLKGRSSSRVERDMKSLGYTEQGHFKIGKDSFSTWQNRNAQRCVRVTSRDGRVRELTNLDAERCS
jgi:hypothetical protein